MTESPYRPVACALHDRYERAIVTRAPTTLSWQDEGQQKRERVLVLALETSQGEEFLCFEDHLQRSYRIRLDCIHLLD